MNLSEVGEIPLVIQPEVDDPESIQIFVTGHIGQKAYPFLLDTGAGQSAVIGNMTLMELKSQGCEKSSGSFGTAREEDWIIVPEIELGPIRKISFPMVRLPKHVSAINLLGMDVLQHYACHFCFSRAKLFVKRPGPSQSDQSLLNLFLDNKAHPYINAAFESSTLSALWDSGAGMTVVDLKVIADNPAQFDEVGESVGLDATGVRRVTPVFRMGELWIGGCLFQPHKVVGVDLSRVNADLDRPMDMILGGNLILREDWWFDFPNKKWMITSHPNAQAIV